MSDPAPLPFDRLIPPCLRKHDVDTQLLLIEAISPTVAFILLDAGTLAAGEERRCLAAIGTVLLLHTPWAVQLEYADEAWFLWVSRRLDAVPPPVAEPRPRAPDGGADYT